MKHIYWNALTDSERQRILLRPAEHASEQICQTVSTIKQQVIQEGDAALYQFAKDFDKVELTDLKISKQDIDFALTQVPDYLKAAIDIAYRNIYAFHSSQCPKPIAVESTPGVLCELTTRPIDKVGLYIPGGTAPLFSTVLMLGIPASIAGCQKVVLCSPAPIAPEIIYTATLCGIKDIYAIGGAGAVFAMAYGTHSVPKVDKIFGPGNAFVTEAKRQVMMTGTAIDMPAGPSEVLVIADDTANSAFVASDLLSQAEHGADSQVVLVTPSAVFANKVMVDIEKQLAILPRASIAKQALEHSLVIIAEDLAQCVRISNEYAPEHLIIQTHNPRQLLANIKHAGSVFLGDYSPESMGDYASGTNHVLPTYGYARTVSSLSLADFSKRMTVQELTAEGFLQLADSVEVMAKTERLDAHALAVQLRVSELKSKDNKATLGLKND